MKDIYVHKREKWDAKKCLAMSKYNPKNSYGDKAPYKGIISSSGSGFVQLGRIQHYNGGTIIEGELYHRELYPLPVIDKGYKFVNILSWGIAICKKEDYSQFPEIVYCKVHGYKEKKG